jgi:hypothetical protein
LYFILFGEEGRCKHKGPCPHAGECWLWNTNRRTAAKIQATTGPRTIMRTRVTGKSLVSAVSYQGAWLGCQPRKAGIPSLHSWQAEVQMLGSPGWGMEWATTGMHPVWVVQGTHNCHTQMFWLSLSWGFPVYYFCVFSQWHSCQRVMGCQVWLLPVWYEETSSDGKCHFLGSDVHTRHQQLMLFHWPCLLLEQARKC